MTCSVARRCHIDRTAIFVAMVCRPSVRIMTRVYNEYYDIFNGHPNSSRLESVLILITFTKQIVKLELLSVK